MGLYKYIRNAWNSEGSKELQRKRLTTWRAEDTTVRIERPTRLDRARSLGYRAKPGIIVVRQRVDRGGRQRPSIRAGRRTAHNFQQKNLSKNYQQIAEERANEKYKNCEVLNSYQVGVDGLHYWFEIILIDRDHPAVLADPLLKNVTWKKGRTNRGLTSSGKKSRGLRNKGFGAEKSRPSNRAAGGHAN